MIKSALKIFIFCSICLTVFLGLGSSDQITVLVPNSTDSLAYENNSLFIISVDKEFSKELLVSTQWESERVISINTKETKENFPKEFYKIFPPQSSIQTLAYSFVLSSGYTKPETLSYKYSDTMTIRKFWQSTSFANFIKRVTEFNAPSILLNIKGWKDSLYTTEFDDPGDDSRKLFKINIPLISGNNTIYFSVTGHTESRVEYFVNHVRESSSTESRDKRFHNSELEQTCSPCHEGLPSSASGDNMTADCLSCHKTISHGEKVHGPVDMKECSSCHSWSKDKNSVVVEKGVPEVCYDCHTETKSVVENSAFPHAVGSECVSCHSPHSSRGSKLLKQDVFRICSSCHEDYVVNHPVERHPLRFTKISNNKNEEISCVSCHNPHGSNNKAMLKAAGGKMAICLNCHNK